MKYSATLNKSKNVNNFHQSILFFAIHFLNTYDPAEGEKWLHDFGGYIQNSEFPCTKINIDPFCKYPNIFCLTLYYKDTKIMWMKIEVSEQKIMKVYNYSYFKKDFEMFHNIITDYFKKRNTEIWNTMLKTCNISDNDNEITVTDYRDYQPNGKTETLKGTLGEIFETYTTHNDRLKYCNGMYWRFQSPQISMLYAMFIRQYDGNYFLDNAVRRGVTID